MIQSQSMNVIDESELYETVEKTNFNDKSPISN
jgi:hypothetical protein